MPAPTLQTLYRFPVKGFPGQKLEQVDLEAGRGIPFDRRYAITNGVIDEGGWMRSRNFFVNATVDDMMKFGLDFDGSLMRLENIKGATITLEPGDVSSLEAANQKIVDFMQPVGVQADLPEPRLIDRGEGGAIWDYADTPFSIINAETVKAIGQALGEELDPVRFRGNLVIEGLPAWEEFAWMGKRIRIGEVEFDVHRPTDRCPTPGVNPETGERDIKVTPGINEHFGHIYCGMYAKVTKGGTLQAGDEISVIGDGELSLEECIVINASKYAQWPRSACVTDSIVNQTETIITLKATGPWPLPDGIAGQRLRLHLGKDGWTSAYLTDVEVEKYEITIEDSPTSDPLTAHLRKGFEPGTSIVISGPYGRR